MRYPRPWQASPDCLRGVASSDLEDLDMPHCDVLLVGLLIDPGELNREYDPYVTRYTAVSDADRITVTAMSDPSATLRYLDNLSRPLADADLDTAGFQADLEPGATFVRVRAMSEHLQAERTYTMLVANGELFRRYDANRIRVIERAEVLRAVRDYFDGDLTRDEVIGMIQLYFLT